MTVCNHDYEFVQAQATDRRDVRLNDAGRWVVGKSNHFEAEDEYVECFLCGYRPPMTDDDWTHLIWEDK